MNEVLKDVRWRAGWVEAAKCDGKTITAIYYRVYARPERVYANPDSQRSESIYALFVDGKFEKLIRWFRWDGPERSKVGDNCEWLTQAMKREAARVNDLKKEVKAAKAPPEHVDPGLTAVYLGLRALGLAPGPPPREKDPEKLRKNIALRDQFNAARLNIGMTEAEVRATFKAKPVESGNVEAGDYSIYGSNAGFNVNDWRCFSTYLNILVVFRDGKAIAISNIASGLDWRQKLEKTVIDLPKRDAAAGSSGHGSDEQP
jgi:hypothetical protein